jgi:arabinofuranosyltransferase
MSGASKYTGLGVGTRDLRRWFATRWSRLRTALASFALPALSGPAGRGALTALLLWLSVAYAVHVMRVFGGPTIDDAAITYSYADNLAHGHGLRLTPGEAPTEGFSNFLQVLLLAPFARFTDLDLPAKWMNVGALAAMLFLLARFVATRLHGLLCLLAALPVLIVFSWPGFSYWTASGLEGGLLAALQIGSLLLLAYLQIHIHTRTSPAPHFADLGLGLCAGLLAFCRPEGVVYGGIAIAARVLAGPGWRRPAALFAGLVGLLVGVR